MGLQAGNAPAILVQAVIDLAVPAATPAANDVVELD